MGEETVMSERPALVCFLCGKPTEPVEKDYPYQPYGATLFTTTGHYGSTVFDSMGGRSLEIAICDDHIRENAHRMHHLTSQPAVRPEPERKVWDPSKDWQ